MKKIIRLALVLLITAGLVLTILGAIGLAVIYPTLPSLEVLTNYRPKLPLKIYSAENELVAEFGEERRAYVSIDKIPKVMKDAVLAIEDRRFYEHHGVDFTGVLRAIKNNLTGRSHEGASTITMQVAKNFFTTPGARRNFVTKIKETLLAIKIEKALSKDQILELYLNQIYLGQRSYGFAAASQVYFDKPLANITLAESALLAALPKAPSTYNPYNNPKRAIARQHEVLRDMQRFGFISKVSFENALQQPLKFKRAKLQQLFAADYAAEMVRQMLFDRYQEQIYSSGMKVYTTIKKSNQLAANQAVTQGLIEYDLRQGHFSVEKNVNLNQFSSSDGKLPADLALDDFEIFNDFVPAVVLAVTPKTIKLHLKGGEEIIVSGANLGAAKKLLLEKDPSKQKIQPGAVVRAVKLQNNWTITQLPKVESALVAIDPSTGAINALVGGFDFHRNKFNHITQSVRQPGSSFKPFIYSAALEKGLTAASIIEDAPLSFSADELGSTENWEPQNFDEKFAGPMRLRSALVKSKNMVSIRVLQNIGPSYAQNYITKFGFAAKDHPAYLAMALGSGQTTPLELARGYAVFANGGYLIKPYLIRKIVDNKGDLISEVSPITPKNGAPRVIDVRNAFLMNSMMQDVIKYGTAKKALSLDRPDIAGKTGTTNNQMDAWFAGYSPSQVAVTWMGYDQPQSLGKDETGGKAALPIWIKYMSTVLAGTQKHTFNVPDGIETLKIDSYSGTLVDDDQPGIFEYFYQENIPVHKQVELPPLFDANEVAPIDMSDINQNQPSSSDILDAGKEMAGNKGEAHVQNQEVSIKKQAREYESASNKNQLDNPASKVLNPSGY